MVDCALLFAHRDITQAPHHGAERSEMAVAKMKRQTFFPSI
jgi:hypothetical protein